MNVPADANSSVWSSLALVRAPIATSPSPPGRLSITTDLPQRPVSRSANSRASISIALPGPDGTMNLTVRCGHDDDDACACIVEVHATPRKATTRKATTRIIRPLIATRIMPPCCDGDAANAASHLDTACGSAPHALLECFHNERPPTAASPPNRRLQHVRYQKRLRGKLRCLRSGK